MGGNLTTDCGKKHEIFDFLQYSFDDEKQKRT